MKISVRVKPKARQNLVEEISKSTFKVSTTAPATDNKANQAVIKLLAEHFGVSQSKIQLIAGQKVRDKIFEVG